MTNFIVEPPYVLLPWSKVADDTPVRLALVGFTPEGGAGPQLVETGRFAGGRRYLAVVADRANRVSSWLELWIQSPFDLIGTPPAMYGLMDNRALDAEWTQVVEALRTIAPEHVIESGWEAFPTQALAIDLVHGGVFPIVDDQQRPLRLCRDDHRLQTEKRATYSASLERWFESVDEAGKVMWHGGAQPLAQAGAAGTLALNPAAGGMVLRHVPLISLERVTDLFSPVATEADTTPVEGIGGDDYIALEKRAWRSAASILQAPAPFAENDSALALLLVRLKLWEQVVSEVQRYCSRNARPLFNIAMDSFRVEIAEASSLVPGGVSFRARLVQPGAAVVIKVPALGQGFVLAGNATDVSGHGSFGGWSAGPGNIRLSQVVETGGDEARLEGTLEIPELRGNEKPASVWVSVPLGNTAVTFVALIEPEQANARNVRFKATVPNMGSEALARLKRSTAPRLACHYHSLRPTDPAYDVHALGLIGIRLILGADAVRNGLNDDLFDLAAMIPTPCDVAQLATVADAPGLSERMERLLSPDAWNSSSNGGVARELWFAVIRELTEFVTIEEDPQRAFLADDSGRSWMEPLNERLSSLRQLVHHLGGLVVAPRAAHEELARTIYRFVRSER
jgi:hypothetical protein